MSNVESFAIYRKTWYILASLSLLSAIGFLVYVIFGFWLINCLFALVNLAFLMVGWWIVAIKFLIRDRGTISLWDWVIVLLTTAYLIMFWIFII